MTTFLLICITAGISGGCAYLLGVEDERKLWNRRCLSGELVYGPGHPKPPRKW